MNAIGTRDRFPDHQTLGHFQTLATPIWVFDVDHHCMWWANEAAVSFWEAVDLQDLLERDFSSDSETVRMRIRQIVESSKGRERIQDTWTLYPNDVPKTVILSFLPVIIGDGRNAMLIEVSQFLDNSADQASVRLLEAARASALMVSTFTADGRLLAQNPAALACYGAPSPTLSGNDLACRLKDPAAVEPLLRTASGGANLDTEQQVRTLGGFRVHRIRSRPGRDPVTGAYVTLLSEEDITQQSVLQRRLEDLNEQLEAKVAARTQALRISEERYALATESASIWDWDVERNLLYVSPNFIKALSYDEGEFQATLARSSIIDFLHPDDIDGYRAELERHLKDPTTPFDHEHRFMTGTGEYRWFHAVGKCVVDGYGRAVRSVGLLTDITERKDLEASVFRTQRMEAIGQLTGGIAHDFNNLLTVIQGNAELLEMMDDPDHTLAEQIRTAAQRGAELTRHLLAFSRKQTLIPKTVDLRLLVDGMRNSLLRYLGEGIRITSTADADLWGVHADPTQIESAILHVALNSRDAMPDGGQFTIASRNLKLVDRSRQPHPDLDLTPGDYVEIRMQDTGSGMCEEELARAFEPFFTTKEVGKGSGLGLSMVFGFSRQSGGAAAITSSPKRGTTVSVFLPRSGEDLPRPALVQGAEAVPGKGETVLVLEDNSSVMATVCGILETLNYQVSQSSNAKEALAVLQGGALPDLVLADVVLPCGESGIEFSERLARDFPSIKVILMSGYPDVPGESGSAMEGRWAFLQKPLDRVQLSRLLHAHLSSGG